MRRHVAFCLSLLPLLSFTEFNGVGGAPETRRAVGDFDSWCVDCHQDTQTLSHPLGGVLEDAGTLPLGANGGLRCLTCHDERTLRFDHGEQGAGRFFLRKSPRALCASCHVRGGSFDRVAHGLVFSRAHLLTRPLRRGQPGKLDPESKSCLACHDATMGADGHRVLDSAQPTVKFLDPRAPHPVGMLYQRSGSKPKRLKALAGLPPEVRLAESQVGCGACHSYYSEQRAMLFDEPRDGRLCWHCHQD